MYDWASSTDKWRHSLQSDNLDEGDLEQFFVVIFLNFLTEHFDPQYLGSFLKKLII